MAEREEELRRRFTGLGFDEVRWARLGDVPADGLNAWLAWGHQAGMVWMERTREKRLEPGLVLPGARSIIVLGVSYANAAAVPGGDRREAAPAWARYALHEDYHDTIEPALVQAGRILEELYGASPGDHRCYVDTGPVMERGWAERAGLGFLGKNAMLISRRHGNWLLLAVILTRIELAPDPPLRSQPGERIAGITGRIGLLCGKCTRCLQACPTDALPHPGMVDARRCISYLTIEHKGAIPRELRPGVGRRVFGCDACLEVCPWNRFAQAGRQILLVARRELADLSLGDLLALTPERFAAVFHRTPVKRLKPTGLLRNACVVAGNTAAGAGPEHESVGLLVKLAASPSALVRQHAVWAVHRIAGTAAAGLLAGRREIENDPAVLEEYAAWSGPPPAAPGGGPLTGPAAGS